MSGNGSRIAGHRTTLLCQPMGRRRPAPASAPNMLCVAAPGTAAPQRCAPPTGSIVPLQTDPATLDSGLSGLWDHESDGSPRSVEPVRPDLVPSIAARSPHPAPRGPGGVGLGQIIRRRILRRPGQTVEESDPADIQIRRQYADIFLVDPLALNRSAARSDQLLQLRPEGAALTLHAGERHLLVLDGDAAAIDHDCLAADEIR